MKGYIKKLMPLCALVSVALNGAAVQNGCSADYVIVGLGTAGAVLAAELSLVNSVVVLEAGPNLATDPVVLSPQFNVAETMWSDPKYSENPTFNYGLINGGTIPSPYSNGRMWGGSSAHNGLITVRGSTDLWDDYATVSGNPQWNYENILPVMLYLEDYTPTNSVANYLQRGQNGPWYVTQFNYNDIVDFPFAAEYAGVLGVPVVVDYNDPTNAGANPAPNYLNVGVSINQNSVTPPINSPESMRSFSVNAFLPQTAVDYNTGVGLNGRKLLIVSDAYTTKILFNGTKAIGAEYILESNPEKVYRVFANKGVILCAGGTATPALLQLSGVGPAALLNSLDIPVVVDSPLVGANLQNHFGPVALVGTPEGAFPPFDLGESFFGISNVMTREVQVFFQAGTLLFPNNELARALGVTPMDPFAPTVSIPFQLVKNNSRGTVQIISTDPLVNPQIDFKFFEPTAAVPNNNNPTIPGTDAYNAVQCLRKLEAFNTIPGYSVIYPTPADYAGTDQQLFDNICLNTVLIQDHGSCTCTMGTDISNGVVDANGNVFGTQNLIVVDNSICTRINTGNTQYPPYVFALRIAKNLGAPLPFA